MKLICDDKIIETVIEPLKIDYSLQGEISLDGLEMVHTENKNFYFERTKEQDKKTFKVIDLPHNSAWELDKFQSPLFLQKKGMNPPSQERAKDKEKQEDEEDKYFAYFPRPATDLADGHRSLAEIKNYKDQNLQLKYCDIYLLIPGKLAEPRDESWNRIEEIESESFNIFRENINQSIKDEYSTDFYKKICRKSMGRIELEIKDLKNGQIYRQDAILSIVKYQTGFCILEIIVQNCAIGGNKLLNYYCSDQINYICQGKNLSLNELMASYKIKRYGKKRSMVFSYGEISDREIINALANEEDPMAEIVGSFAKKVTEGNIAQYDSAQVFVSEETMFEKCKSLDASPDQRVAYHAIEIFFIELLLFQDAAIDKIFTDLQREGEKQKSKFNLSESSRELEDINFDMAEALHSFDYDQFKFPTVRESAKRISKSFGIDFIYEKYEINKDLLESMINANKRKIEEEQEKITNRFLMLISVLTAVGTLGQILYSFFNNEWAAKVSYTMALLIMIISLLVYRFFSQQRKKIIKKKINIRGKKRNGK